MKTRSLVVAALLAVVMVVGSGVASAAPVQFANFSNNDPPAVTLDLTYDVIDGGTYVDFVIANNDTTGSIANVYFGYSGAGPNPLVLPATALIPSGAGVDFSANVGGPSSMPAGAITSPFYYASADAPAPTNGINPGESLTIRFDYASKPGFEAAWAAGEFAIGLHVIDIDGPQANGSDWYLSTRHEDPIPEPATMALLGLGIAGLALRRGKSMLRG